MAYVIIGLIIVVGGSLAFGAYHIHEENSPADRPSLKAARRSLRGSRMLVSGASCECGGRLGPTGQRSRRHGHLLGCSDCDQVLSADGRRVIRRSPMTGGQPDPAQPLSYRRTPLDTPAPQPPIDPDPDSALPLA
jgi:hypothetical protein